MEPVVPNAEISSATSSILSDLPGTPDEIARSYATADDDHFRALDQLGDRGEATAAAYDVFNGHAQVDGASDDYVPPSSKKSQKRVAPKKIAKPRKRAKNDKWEVDFVTQDPKSPLVTAQLKSILANPEAFSSLTLDQQSHIIALMPDGKHVIDENEGKPKISPNFLKYDPDWSYYVHRFQEDISEGRNDPTWISQARQALEQRQNGDFDDFKDAEYEVFWGVKQKIAHNVIAGESSSLNLNTLFKERLLRKGDVWALRRRVAGTGRSDKAAAIIIEKEIKIVDVSDVGLPTVHMPPGVFKMSKPGEREDIIIAGVSAPGTVEKKALEEYDIKNAPNANAWKTIRVMRDNQDLGSLWDIRQAFSFRNR